MYHEQAGRLANEVKKLQSQTWAEKSLEAERDLKLHDLQAAREAVRYQFVIDILDVWIPATNIGLVNLNDGVLGIFGYVTVFLRETLLVRLTTIAVSSPPLWLCASSGSLRPERSRSGFVIQYLSLDVLLPCLHLSHYRNTYLGRFALYLGCAALETAGSLRAPVFTACSLRHGW